MDPTTALAGIPPELRKELLVTFSQIVVNYRERRWEPSELNGGKLCEVVYSILRGHVDGKMPPRALKPKNMYDACRLLESADATRFSRSIRVQIPRLLMALYEVRNNRGVGHVGGDVDPNSMDSKLVLESAKWIVAELIRVFHSLKTDEAMAVVEAVVERTVPIVWQIETKRRVLRPGMSMKDQVLLLLYSSSGPVSERELIEWTEHSNASIFRRDVLARAHKSRLLEYDVTTGQVHISPRGIEYVESGLPLDIAS